MALSPLGTRVITQLIARLSLFLGCSLLAADSIYVKVVSVSDGDTIQVVDNGGRRYKVRLASIDAPEKSQPFSDAAKQHLSDSILGRAVRVEWRKRDHYGRIVGTVYYGIVDVNLEMVKNGLAWHYKEFAREQAPSVRESYASGELAAKRARLGIWSHSSPIPPWAYRKGR